MAVSLIGFAQSMLFSAPSSSSKKNGKNDKKDGLHVKTGKYEDDNDSDESKYVSKRKGWGWGKSTSASALSRDQDDAVYQHSPLPPSSSFGQMAAPPTDSELSSKGLDFAYHSVPPPNIAEDLMKATPRGGQIKKNSHMRPPDDVSLAVAIAKRNSPRKNSPNSINTSHITSPQLKLLTPSNSAIYSSSSSSLSDMNSPSTSFNTPPLSSPVPPHRSTSSFPPPSLSPVPPRNSTANGYSMGALPPGVKWRYVDVLSNRSTIIDQEQMK